MELRRLTMAPAERQAGQAEKEAGVVSWEAVAERPQQPEAGMGCAASSPDAERGQRLTPR